MGGDYVKLGDLLVYKISIELSDLAWNVYEKLGWQEKKIIGDQFIRSVDSVGANIAEGYGRFHYLDRIKFYYNSRGSLYEAKHWVFTMKKRGQITEEIYKNFLGKAEQAGYQLNQFISSTYKSKQK